jgi:outer membrane protein assembly factor BamB
MAFLFVSCGGDSGSSVKSRFPASTGTGTGGGGELADGMEIWSFDLNTSDDELKIAADPFEDLDSSPAVGEDGTIYIGSLSRQLYAINPDGTLKWTFDTGDAINGSAAIGSDGTIYIGSMDRQVYAINPDGTLQWVVPTKSVFSSSPAVGVDGTIYIGSRQMEDIIFPCGNAVVGLFYAISPQGKIKWQAELSGDIHSSPAVADDGTIYVGTTGDNNFIFDREVICDENSEYPPSAIDPGRPVNGHLYAINPDGTIKWDFRAVGDVDSSPAIGIDGTIYVGSDASIRFFGEDRTILKPENPLTFGYLYAINPDGTLRWYFDAFGHVDSSPVIGSDGTIYIGSDKNDFFALNPDGSIKWIYPTRGDINSTPAIADDGTIYFGTNADFDDDVYALNPDGTVKWRFDTGGSVNSSPSIGSDGTVYIGSKDNKLYALKAGSALANTPWPKFHKDLNNTGRKE